MAKLIKMTGVSDYAARQLGKDKDVSTEVLTKVCAALNCEVQDIVDFLPEKKEKMDGQISDWKENECKHRL